MQAHIRNINVKFVRQGHQVKGKVIAAIVKVIETKRFWNALTYKLFLYASKSSKYLGQGRVSRSLGQGQGHCNATKSSCIFAGGPPT